MVARTGLFLVASLALFAVPARADAPPRAPRATLVEVLRGGKQVLVLDRATGDYAVKKRGDTIQGFRIIAIEDDQIVLAGAGKAPKHYVIPLFDRTPLPPMKTAPTPAPATSPTQSELEDPYAAPDVPEVAAPDAPPVAAPDAPPAEAEAPADDDGGVMDPYAPAGSPTAPTSAPAPAPAPTPAPAAPAAAPSPSAPPARAAAAPAAKGRAPRIEKRKLSRKELDKALSDFAALTREIKIERATGGGIVVTELAKGSFPARAGIKKGDVVRRVAGHSIDTVDDAASAYAAVVAGKQVVVEIDRRGARLHITYQLTD